KIGMKLPGLVTNITNFGAYVDIGVHQDGLVHLSQLAIRYVKDANEVVKVNQQVEVRVTEIDVTRKRISLSMKNDEATPVGKPAKNKKAKVTDHPKKQSKKDAQSDMQSKLAMLKA